LLHLILLPFTFLHLVNICLVRLEGLQFPYLTHPLHLQFLFCIAQYFPLFLILKSLKFGLSDFLYFVGILSRFLNLLLVCLLTCLLNRFLNLLLVCLLRGLLCKHFLDLLLVCLLRGLLTPFLNLLLLCLLRDLLTPFKYFVLQYGLRGLVFQYGLMGLIPQYLLLVCLLTPFLNLLLVCLLRGLLYPFMCK